jgi:hypothetical protein
MIGIIYYVHMQNDESKEKVIFFIHHTQNRSPLPSTASPDIKNTTTEVIFEYLKQNLHRHFPRYFLADPYFS